jgi:uncharacterized protein
MNPHKLPWLRQRKGSPELPLKPPVQIGALSNGEIFRPNTPASERTHRLILEKADEGARRLGIDRREFLASSMGMATSLWAINVVSGCGNDDDRGRAMGDIDPSQGTMRDAAAQAQRDAATDQLMRDAASGGGPNPVAPPVAGGMTLDGGMTRDAGPADAGGYYDVPSDPTDPDKVCQKMLKASDFFIFDIQTHHVNRANTLYDNFLRDQPQFTSYCSSRNIGPVQCFGREEYVRLMFLESDTTVAVLSGLPAVDDANNPVTNAEIAQSKAFIDSLGENSERLINHHMVLPNQMGPSGVQAQLDAMERTVEMYKKVGAWKTYPAWAPENTETNATGGWFYDDPQTGLKVVQKGLDLGVATFCIHKGLPIPAFSTRYNDPVDIGRVAKIFPQAKFIIYHSAFGHNGYTEGPYSMGSRQGVSALITSLLENGIAPNANVFAELGTTWQLLSTPLLNIVLGGLDGAAHLLGKLLKYVGENNVTWGTDSIWYGSPQSQIESFLQFQISPAFQQQYGYPALTTEIKRKILGLNAARAYGIDVEATRCAIESTKLARHKRNLDGEFGERRWSFTKPLLTSRREFWQLHRMNGFRPG